MPRICLSRCVLATTESIKGNDTFIWVSTQKTHPSINKFGRASKRFYVGTIFACERNLRI